MKVSIRAGRNHSKRVWFVDYCPPGAKRKRSVFKSKAEAEAHAEDIKTQQAQSGSVWLGLSAQERAELVSVHAEVKAASLTLRRVWERYRELARSSTTHEPKTLDDALKDFLLEQKAALVAGKTYKALKSNVGRFVRGREKLRVCDVTRTDALTWLSQPQFSPRTFNTYRTSLNTFFVWCVAQRQIADSPIASIAKIPETRMPDIDEPPAVLSLAQTLRLLKAVLEVDEGLAPYVALGLFGGLRPEREAAKLRGGDVKDGFVCVRGVNAKDRQRRFVPVNPTLAAWLSLVDEDFSPAVNLRRRFEDIRERAGLVRREKVSGNERPRLISTGWAQDVLRHTFASHYLPIHGAEKTIAALGHGDYDMLFRHYRDLVTSERAELYWKITPDAVRDGRFESWLEV